MIPNLLSDAVHILLSEEDYYNENTLGYNIQNIRTTLENANSPVTRKYHEKLFQSVIDKKHIDFGSIEKSKGYIRDYEGYKNMVEVLDTLMKLAAEEKSDDVMKLTKTVQTAISNIENLSSTYNKGFMTRTDYVMLEYNTFVYTCVEATTTLLYEFIEYVKRPDMETLKISLRNNKSRANLFYFEQLGKYNNVIDKMGIEYRKMLENLCNKGKNNFLGVDEMVGVAAVSIVALAIVPVTRELIYQFYRLKGNLAASLELQATFLEMNQVCLEANTVLPVEKKSKIIAKQKKISKMLLRLSDKLKVKTNKSLQVAKKDLKQQNKMISIDGLQDEVSNSPLEML